jgi:hypothetical protein
MNATRWLWILLALAVVVWLVFFTGGGPEKAIHRRLDALAEVIEKDGREGDLQAVARSRELSGFFAEGFRVRAPQVGELKDRARLLQTFVGYRRRHESIGVAFRDRELELQEPAGTASLACVASLSGGEGLSASRDRYRLLVRWRQEGGEWKIADLEVVEVLEGGLGF